MKRNINEKGAAFFKGKVKVIAAVTALIVFVAAGFGIAGVLGGETPVNYSEVKSSKMPADIKSDVIPEYKTLERALACAVDDDIYVVVTRGEKPSSGFNVSIDRMVLEDKNGKDNLIVYAIFEDPQKETAISQIITYPTEVVKTDLDSLPDSIELRIQY